MRNCFVPGCDQLCKRDPKRAMFCVPKDKEVLNAWIAVLPKLRTLKAHDKVCERHFPQEEISTTYDNVINGQVYKIERGRARLRPKAVPSLNLETGLTQVSRRAQKCNKVVKHYREAPKPKPSPAKPLVFKASVTDSDEEQRIEVEQLHESQEVVTEECLSEADADAMLQENGHYESIEISADERVCELFESLYDDIYEVVLPNTLWGVHRCPDRTSIFFSYIEPTMLRTTKMISIDSQGRPKVLLGNRLLNEDSLAVDIHSAESLSDVIAQIDEMKLCPGVFDYESCEVTLKDDQQEVCASCSQGEEQ